MSFELWKELKSVSDFVRRETKVSISQGSHYRFSSGFREMKEEALRKKFKEIKIGKMRRNKAKNEEENQQL